MRYSLLVGSFLSVLTVPVSAFFVIPCASPVVVERADPIVNPGAVSGHVHTIMGGNGFDFDMDYNRARRSTCSTCQAKGDMSNYWVPSMYFRAQNGSFISVNQIGGARIYYQQRLDKGKNESSLIPFPPGFRMLAGNPNARNFTGSLEARAVTHLCLNYAGGGPPQANYLPKVKCPNGVRTQVYFPSCWNGKDLDSPDHKSHMAYPNNVDSGDCPTGFKTRFISLFYEVIWDTAIFKDLWYGNDQPFVLSNGDPTGYGYHGDFVNGWNTSILTDAIHNCIDNAHFGDINQCSPLLPLESDTIASGCKVPPRVNEKITGVLPALPGCNPVQPGPEPAVSHSGCGATTIVGPPQTDFTDLTTTKKWAYLGCGIDYAFSSKGRTLTAANLNSDDMKVEKCVDFCISKGYSIAGLEYSRECYCGNSIAADRAPIPGVDGGCSMKCAGDNSEYCGDGGKLSLYQKCTGATCQNANFGLPPA